MMVLYTDKQWLVVSLSTGSKCTCLLQEFSKILYCCVLGVVKWILVDNLLLIQAYVTRVFDAFSLSQGSTTINGVLPHGHKL